jgi:hypothetical protein
MFLGQDRWVMIYFGWLGSTFEFRGGTMIPQGVTKNRTIFQTQVYPPQIPQVRIAHHL